MLISTQKEDATQKEYYKSHNETLLSAYLTLEFNKNVRIVIENENFVALFPLWSIWPIETMIISKLACAYITDLKIAKQKVLAEI